MQLHINIYLLFVYILSSIYSVLMINGDATQNENNAPNVIKHVIVVMSGKGGTGKTTVAVNLALSAIDNEKVCLADCDVEEPNDNLFLNLPVKKISVVS